MKRFTTLFILLFSFSLLVAQDKILTMQDAILGSKTKLKIENISGLKWLPKSDTFCYVDSLNESFGLISAHAENTNHEMLLTLDSLNSILKTSGFKTVKRFPAIKWIDEQRFRFKNDHKIFEYLTYKLSSNER